MKQQNMFEELLPAFKFPRSKKIRLFETFAGIGCQRMALKRLGMPFESVGVSEIDKYALKSYEAIHGDCVNYGDITKMQEIPDCDILTYSFPCTDLSKAGKQKGLNGTRSGLVYEVLRLLKTAENKPQILIMENVVDLVQVNFKKAFDEICLELESLGYTNYWQVLNAKDYGVAQNRERVFMVSLLGEWFYEFPKPFPLTKCLKDYLEPQVDEKYYLSEKAVKKILNYGGQFMSEYEEVSFCLIAGYYKIPGRAPYVEDERGKRRLSPLECWRLMGISDSDFRKAEKVVSASQLYKQAGNGLIVDLFALIIKNLICKEELCETLISEKPLTEKTLENIDI